MNRSYFATLIKLSTIITTIMIIYVVAITCAPGGMDCDPSSSVSSAYINSADKIVGLDHKSFGGYLAWKDDDNKDKECIALIRHISDNKIKVITGFHCVRDISIDRISSEHPDDIKLSIDYNILNDQNQCKLKNSQGVTPNYIKIPIKQQHVEISYLTKLDSYLLELLSQHQYQKNDLNDQTKQVRDWLVGKMKTATELFAPSTENLDFNHTEDSEQQNEFNRLFNQLACSTNPDHKNQLKQFCDSNTQHQFCQFYNDQNYYHACFLHTDIAALEIELKNIDYYRSPNLLGCLQPTLDDWDIEVDSDLLKAMEDFQKFRLSENLEKESLNPLLEAFNGLHSVKALDQNFNQGTVNAGDDENITLHIDQGVHMISSFKTSSADSVFIHTRIPFSKSYSHYNKLIDQPKSINQLSSYLSALIKISFGYVVIYNQDFDLKKTSSGSLFSFGNHIIAGLHSVENEEFSGSSIRTGTTVPAKRPVDIAFEQQSNNDPISSDVEIESASNGQVYNSGDEIDKVDEQVVAEGSEAEAQEYVISEASVSDHQQYSSQDVEGDYESAEVVVDQPVAVGLDPCEY